MRISDWSSDVCSSDLEPKAAEPAAVTAGPPSTTVPQENDHGSCKSIRRPHRHYRRAVRPRPPATAAVRCDRRPDRGIEIGRAHVCTPVTNAQLVCRLLLEKKKNIATDQNKHIQLKNTH